MAPLPGAYDFSYLPPPCYSAGDDNTTSTTTNNNKMPPSYSTTSSSPSPSSKKPVNPFTNAAATFTSPKRTRTSDGRPTFNPFYSTEDEEANIGYFPTSHRRGAISSSSGNPFLSPGTSMVDIPLQDITPNGTKGKSKNNPKTIHSHKPKLKQITYSNFSRYESTHIHNFGPIYGPKEKQ